MNAMEKVAWTELLVSMMAVIAVTALYPWLGNAATGAFGLLGLVVCSMWFLRRRGAAVLVDERDRAIERRAKQAGISAAWMTLVLALIVIGQGLIYLGEKQMKLSLLNWLIWIQFAIFLGVKGLVGIVNYRRQSLAA